MRVAANDDIDAGQVLCQYQIIAVLVMSQENDLVDASSLQFINHGLGGFSFVQKFSGVGRAGAVAGFVGNVDADDTNLFTAHLLDRVGLDVISLSKRSQRCTDLGLYVGRQNRCVTAATVQQVQELFESFVATVEFVIAQGEGIETYLVHQFSICLALERSEIQGAGDGVPGMQLENVVQFGFAFRNFGRNPREAASGKLCLLAGNGQGL